MILDVNFYLNIKKHWADFGYHYTMSYDVHSNKVFDRYFLDVPHCCEIKPADEVKNLVGVTKGKGDNSVIITYSHFVQVFVLSPVEPYYELKEEWKTKLRLTCAVTYDAQNSCYIGVFHDLSIRTWTSHIQDIQLTEKYVFSSPILQILLRENFTPLIIFKNGYCTTLPYGLENCKMLKTRGLLKETTTIEDVAFYTWNKTDYICYIVKDKNKKWHIVTCALTDEATDSSRMETVKVIRNDNEDDVYITSKLIVASGTKIHPFVYFTWSNSIIGKYYLTKKYWKHIKENNRTGPTYEEMSRALIEKNYIVSYGKGYSNVKDSHSMLIANMDPVRQITQYQMFYEKQDKKTRIYCPVKGFAITVDSKSIKLWTITLDKAIRKPQIDFNTALLKIIASTTLPYFPVMGYSRNKAWRIANMQIT